MDTALPHRRYRGASRDERQQERRARLLHAAIKVYGETGYRSATVRAVCQAAGLTERYFYESFPNSEALLIAAYEAATRSLVAEIVAAQALDAGSPETRLRAGLTCYFTSLRGDPMVARVFLVELPGVSEAADQAQDRALEIFADLLSSVQSPATSDGLELKALMTRGLVGAIFGIARHWIGCDYAQPIQTVVEASSRLCAVALHGV
jgi:AcrR family transcriptional regulator